MAANDYYKTSYGQSSQQNLYHDGNEAPVAPYSPLGHQTYPYSQQAPSQSYEMTGARIHGETNLDPFVDTNAIPLHGRPLKDGAATEVSLISHQHTEDPFMREVDMRKDGTREKGGWFRGKITWVVFVLSFIQLVIFIVELAKAGTLTGSPIEIHPAFNPMIGPSPYVLINMGSRYGPCMHSMLNVTNSTTSISWPCPNATSLTGDDVSCSLTDLCGFGLDPSLNPPVNATFSNGTVIPSADWRDRPAPGQWWRFIVPIFLHAGIIHITFNLLLQLTLGRDVEKLIGSIRFAIVYFASGIFGFVLGGNFAASGISSCGCSGSLFGILAITLLDLFYTWKQRAGPIKDLLFILVDIVIAFILGLLPGLDNFSHIGGFLMGLVLGVCLLRSPSSFTRTARAPNPTVRYSGISAPAMREDREHGLVGFVRNPLSFFQNRRGIWWSWWIVRALSLVGCLISFILLLKNFYEWRTTCGWCKYLSCMSVTVGGQNWCDVGNLNFTTTTTTPSGGSN